MTLKVQTKTVHSLDAWDLDDFIRETYGVDLCFAADQEAPDDSSHEFTVDGDYEEDRVNDFLQGKHVYFVAGDVLNYMAKEGHIPTGDYLISAVS